ncbi:L,D-transpeptidase catalytic domain [Enhygromyxa salina]|uniref:L,D-transpeptidase catalytic domain n=1 Tax=Enhygromyxa salina TaxID=215803 RepID=A0A2S9YEQ7_9BACT|nr:L,D-transpeptidase [Enhygromyxa salina]PRQ03583.1 L,D-transpeptidase catalytic domain [Enhygromyxa salina]
MMSRALPLGFCLLGLACTPDSPTAVEQDPTPQPSTEREAASSADLPSAEAGAEEAESAETNEGGEVEPEGEDPGEIGPQEPPDYGVFKFPTEPPSDDQLTLHGAAGYEVVAVYAEPSRQSTRLGFLRIGARMRVGEKLVNEDCHKGWHALEGGGYACASRGLMVDTRPPFMSYEPAPPRTDEPFPYDWAYVRQWNTPMWWQVPNAEQLLATREKRAILEAERTGEPLPGSEPAPAAPVKDDGGEGAAEGDAAELPAPDSGEDGDAAAGDEGGDGGGGDGGGDDGGGEDGGGDDPGDDGGDDPSDAAADEPEEEPEPVNIPFSPKPWLEKGYFLSLGETIRDGDRGYWRTARGGIVEKSKAHSYKPKDYQGAALTEDMSFPVGFVMTKKGTKLLRLGDDDKLHATGKTLDKRTFLDLGEEVELSGRAYFTVIPHPPADAEAEPADAADSASPEGGDEEPEDQLFVKADVMRTPDLQPIPKGLDPWDRWIDVDITKQMLVAYEGSRPVYVTLVSTGKKGSDEEPFETPTGRFRIRGKQITSNMDGTTATDGNYAIQDVPWVMYFEGSYALHGAFWHQSFGYVRSHGCVNLGPSDARWLFGWSTPFVPEGWHGAMASDENPGTTIVIRRSEDK